MTDATNLEIYNDLLIVLGTAGVIVPLLRRAGVPPVLGYLMSGAVLGPLGLGAVLKGHPALSWFTVSNPQSVTGIGELGVVFLLFLIGLELSIRRLVIMRRLVFGLGGLQVLVSAAGLGIVASWSGLDATAAAIVGMSLGLSSTAIVLELLSRQGRLTTSTGRVAFSTLLAQDLAVVPILVFISVLSAGATGSVMASTAGALIKAILVIGVLVAVGRILLRPLFQMVTSAESPELFIAAALFVIIAAGLVAHHGGVSMALGAFIVALLLAETAYGKAIEVAIDPFKGLLLGVFFFTVGMKIDFREFLRDPFWLFAVVLGLVVLKTAIFVGLAGFFRVPWRAATEAGVLLGPGGEFAFVSIGMASASQLVDGPTASFILAATASTMVLTPILAAAARRFIPDEPPPATIDPELTVEPPAAAQHAIVVGYGRVGKVVCALLKHHGIAFVAIDHDPSGVARDRRQGHMVFFGDASDPRFLEISGLRDAKAVIITINARDTIDVIVDRVRSMRPDIRIIARARDEDHARHLYAVGASDVVPETIEASFQLSEAVLIGLGVPAQSALASVQDRRDAVRRKLQGMPRTAGNGTSQAAGPRIDGSR